MEEGVELLGHTGFIGAFAFYAPEYEAVLVGTHNESEVEPLAARSRALSGAPRGGLIRIIDDEPMA